MAVPCTVQYSTARVRNFDAASFFSTCCDTCQPCSVFGSECLVQMFFSSSPWYSTVQGLWVLVQGTVYSTVLYITAFSTVTIVDCSSLWCHVRNDSGRTPARLTAKMIFTMRNAAMRITVILLIITVYNQPLVPVTC